MSKKSFPYKEISKTIKKITPDLEHLLDLLDQADDATNSVIEDNIRNGTNNLLIAKRVIKDRKK